MTFRSKDDYPLPTGRRLISDETAHSRGDRNRRRAVRRAVLRDTIDAFARAAPGHYQQIADRNLAEWSNMAESSPSSVTVLVEAQDWGDLAGSLTKRLGVTFAVLNMANAYVPGGAYVEGAPAQEENMFRRTDCHFFIDNEVYDSTADRYRPHMTELLQAENGRVFLDTESPRVCIRGAEDARLDELGYRWLDDGEIFAYYELRSAAVDLRDGSNFDGQEMRRRVVAQLSTLRSAGIRHAVLSAFGCGAFGNPPEEVAAIYRDEIGRMSDAFSVIAFAIQYAGYGSPDNFAAFESIFSARF